MFDFDFWFVVKKFQNLTFKVNFLCQKLSNSFSIFFIEEYQFRGTFFISIDFMYHQNWMTFVPKISEKFGFFDSHFWPFNKCEEKIKVIFVITAIIPSIWNGFFFKFRWRDEKFTMAILNNMKIMHLKFIKK